MSYANMAALATDEAFVGRINACATEQAYVFKDDGRSSFVALANMILTSGNAAALVPMVCTRPGFGDTADQASIGDPDLLAAVQAVWPTAAGLLFPGGTS